MRVDRSVCGSRATSGKFTTRCKACIRTRAKSTRAVCAIGKSKSGFARARAFAGASAAWLEAAWFEGARLALA